LKNDWLFNANNCVLDQFIDYDTRVPPVQSREPPMQVEPLTLAAVLGSVGLICVAVVVVALIIYRKRRAANPR